MANRLLIKIITLLAISVLCIACNKESQISKKSADSLSYDPGISQIATNVKVKFVDSAYTKAILYADRARVFHKKMETILDKNVRVDFLSKYNGNRISNLIADSVVIFDDSKDMIAFGHVVIVSDSSRTKLETSVIEWKNKEKKLYSTQFVRISSPTENIQGYGFESDDNLRNYKIFKVSGVQK